MPELLHTLLHAVEHAFLDTLKLIPFLFLTYLCMELLEHHAGDVTERRLRRAGRIGPLLGGTLGVLPQCGFSVAASSLYAGRVITTGTLIAVYLSTSDEMLPILISSGAPVPFILKILATKLIVGVSVGFLVDLICRCFGKREEGSTQIEELCEREGCNCEDGVWRSAIKHTLHVTLFVLLFSFCMETAVGLIGEERLASWILDRPVLGNLLSALLGFVPNCASSVLLTTLYLDGILPVGAMLSGLLVNAGVGTALLIRNNRPLLDSLRILLILFLVGVAVGVIVDLTPLSALLSI